MSRKSLQEYIEININKKSKLKNTKAITLISLVITIILLIILSGVVINLTIGKDGLLNYAKIAVDKYSKEAKNEKNMLEELYSQILVAEDSKVTLTMKQLNNYIDEKLEEKMQKVYPDTSKIIANIAKVTDSDPEFIYTATNDCVVMGNVRVYKEAYIRIYINEIEIGESYSSSGQVNSPICYYLKKGDTIKFKRTNNSGKTFVEANAYAVK